MAIWGSCVSRDAFALESRRADLDERLPLVYYGARSSWVSQASRPWPDPEPDYAGLTGFALRMVEEDLEKAVIDRLVEHQPDVLLLDLVDERLQLARVGRTWITASEYTKRTDLWSRTVAEGDEVSSMTQPKRLRLFAAAAKQLARRLVRELPHTVFVLNEAPYVTEVGDGTSLPEPQAGWARELDAAQRPMFGVLEDVFGGRLVRATPPPEVCLADPSHRWGLSSYHYVEEYYSWLLDVLLTAQAPTTPAARRIIDLRPFDVPSGLRGLLRR